jgi:hypothetical protein
MAKGHSRSQNEFLRRLAWSLGLVVVVQAAGVAEEQITSAELWKMLQASPSQALQGNIQERGSEVEAQTDAFAATDDAQQ